MKTVGVIGAGQMGAGIAQVSAQAGYAVLLSDVDQARAEAGKAGIAKQLARAVEKEKIAAADAEAALALLARADLGGVLLTSAHCGRDCLFSCFKERLCCLRSSGSINVTQGGPPFGQDKMSFNAVHTSSMVRSLLSAALVAWSSLG